MVLKNHTRLQANAPIGMLVKEDYGGAEEMHTETHEAMISEHACIDTLSIFGEEAEAFVSYSADCYSIFISIEPSGWPHRALAGAALVLFTHAKEKT